MAKRRKSRPLTGNRSPSSAKTTGCRSGHERRCDRAIAGALLQIGRASCRVRVWQYVEISVGGGSLKKKNIIEYTKCSYSIRYNYIISATTLDSTRTWTRTTT